ncbi:MAG: hypothetical protein LBB94_10010 [Clostridiales bacterium]|jgi:hypothetical protein|nr:hypothetical protein [Clostridiales bacterium]
MSNIFEPQLADIIELLRKFGKMDIAAFGTLDPGVLAERVYDLDLDSAKLFLYLFRRFGLPLNKDHDDYKEACVYYFTTPNPEVFLYVSIKGSLRTNCYFGYAISQSISMQIRKETDKLAAAWRRERDTWISNNNIPADQAPELYESSFPEKMMELHSLCGPLQEKCNEALLTVLRDFLRPVNIRDVYFNAKGNIDIRELEYDEDNEISSFQGMPVADYYS